ncbi:MAG: hypothetical protein H3Z51_06605 [archaeon]|nr:hypothetical protein [archaeon]
MSLNVELRGFEEFRKFCKDFPLKARIFMDEFKDEASRLIAERVRSKSPVRTGALRDSIRPSMGMVEARVPYAKFVEYGTRRMKAQPFLRPAISEMIGDLKRILIENIQEMFRSELK